MNLFDFYIPEWIFIILNLLILTLVLRKILWKSVGKVIDDRQAKITKAMEDAEAANAGRQALDQEKAAFEGGLERRTQEMMKEARTRAGHEYDRIVDEAKQKEKQILAAAQTQARLDRDGLLNAAQKEIIATTIEMAGLLLESKIDKKQNEQLIASFLERKDVRA